MNEQNEQNKQNKTKHLWSMQKFSVVRAEKEWAVYTEEIARITNFAKLLMKRLKEVSIIYANLYTTKIVFC